MPTDVDTDGGGQLGGRSRGERQVRCRLPFRQVKSSQVSLSSPVPSGRGALRAAVRERTDHRQLRTHTAITPHTGVEAMRADRPVAAERPSRRAGRDDGRRRSERERDLL